MRLNFFGDISLFNIDYSSFKYCNGFSELVDSADFNIGNMECPITNIDFKEENQAINMSAAKESIHLLKPFQIVSLANNHVRDFKEQGIIDTISVLEENNIKYFGVGKTQKEAIEALLIEKDGYKLAFFGATRYANASPEKGLGTAKDSFSLMKKHIKQLKKEGYFVIPYFHWGYEYVRIPSPKERKLAHKCIDAGADIVIGSHPHIYQGIEEYKGKTIVYSLGNFVFHSSVFDGLAPIDNDPRLNESFAFAIKINKDFSYKTEIHGYLTKDAGISFYDIEKNEKLIEEVKEPSQILKASKIKYLRAYYNQAYEISKQNIKVRKKYQNIDKQSFKNKLLIYKTANIQDIKNKIAAIFLSITKMQKHEK
jgi:hypothetical protein